MEETDFLWLVSNPPAKGFLMRPNIPEDYSLLFAFFLFLEVLRFSSSELFYSSSSSSSTSSSSLTYSPFYLFRNFSAFLTILSYRFFSLSTFFCIRITFILIYFSFSVRSSSSLSSNDLFMSMKSGSARYNCKSFSSSSCLLD
jgi:hypothetical protein